MDDHDIKSLISATAPRMPAADPDRRELLKRQAQELLAQRVQPGVVNKYLPPVLSPQAEQQYLSAQVLLYELRKRKRDEGF